MAVEYNTCPLLTSELTNTSAIKKNKVCKNVRFFCGSCRYFKRISLHFYKYYINNTINNYFQHASCKKGHKTRYYICLGTLAQLVQTQIQSKYAQNDRLHSIGTKFVKDFYAWIYQSQDERFSVEDFLRSVITSIAFFAVGIKLTNELVAWRLP